MQQGITQSDMSYTGAVLATGTFAVMVLAVSFLASASVGWSRSSIRSR